MSGYDLVVRGSKPYVRAGDAPNTHWYCTAVAQTVHCEGGGRPDQRLDEQISCTVNPFGCYPPHDAYGFDQLRVSLRDGDDTITLTNSDFLHGIVVFLDAGNDTANVVNRAVDDISCGPGDDTVRADKTDLVRIDCEHVQRLP